MLETVLSYAERGWHVFPCQEGGKRPLTMNGCKAATTDVALIRKWWQRRPKANIGIATGKESGIVVLDIDVKHDGHTSLVELEQTYEVLPDTIEVITGSGGRHVWFAHPGCPVANSAGKIGAGLDIRGDGGYVIVPPSIHENGRQYEWEVLHHPDHTTLATIPPWLFTMLQDALSKKVASDVLIREGCRNDTLFRLACSMRRFGASETAILAALSITNEEQCKPPLATAEVVRMVKNACRYSS